MKTINEAINLQILEKAKRIFYAVQLVLIIAAVPALGFLEISHHENKAATELNSADKKTNSEVFATKDYSLLKLNFKTI